MPRRYLRSRFSKVSSDLLYTPCIIAADVARTQPDRVCHSSDRRREQGGDQPCIGDDCDASQFGKISLDARLDAVAPDAEQPRLALETGLEQAVACLETEDRVFLVRKAQRADYVPVVVRVVEVDVAVGLDAVAQHVLVVAPNED